MRGRITGDTRSLDCSSYLGCSGFRVRGLQPRSSFRGSEFDIPHLLKDIESTRI